jgi:hypothetical protein
MAVEDWFALLAVGGLAYFTYALGYAVHRGLGAPALALVGVPAVLGLIIAGAMLFGALRWRDPFQRGGHSYRRGGRRIGR